MNENHTGTPPAGIKLGEVLHAIFRQKWKIIIIAALGIVAACVLYGYDWAHPLYQSEAKLLIKYVVEGKSAKQIAGNDTQVRAVDAQGESIINTELQLLSSLDLARNVAAQFGPDKVLSGVSEAGGSTNVEEAAFFIRGHLVADVPKGSCVIRLLFQHPDPVKAKTILDQVIISYLSMHSEVHGPGGGLDQFLETRKDAISERLATTEKALREAKANAGGIISLEGSKKEGAEQIAKINAAILDAEAQIAERKAFVAVITNLLSNKPVAATNVVGATNTVTVSLDQEAEYKRLCRVLDGLRRNEDELLTYLTPETTRVKDVEAQIAAKEKLKQQMEEKNPGLLATKTWERGSTGPDAAAGLRSDLINESTRVVALQAKIEVLTQQLNHIRSQATNLDSAEPLIVELERKRALDEARFKYFSDNLDQAQTDSLIGPGKISNINTIQAPSPPLRASSKLLKTIAMVLFGSIAGAFALAFAIEFYLDPCLKRPSEVEAKLGVPLFISIPLIRRNGDSHALAPGKTVPLLSENNGNGSPKAHREAAPANHEPIGAEASTKPAPASTLDSEVALGNSSHVMGPFSDALRDRLINFFETRNMTHKPKLVALTSCRQGSGVSTIAAGLAASLSETGDGNVLLVDMNHEEGSAYHFRRGDLACGLEDALKADKRDSALVQDNLYVVAESSTGDNLPRAFPKRFKNLVPQLKASDFDYIIFDLPPVNQVSITPRLARFMDVVMMVIESEKTDVEVLKRGITLLRESQRNIGTVLNKGRSYVPKWLQQQF